MIPAFFVYLFDSRLIQISQLKKTWTIWHPLSWQQQNQRSSRHRYCCFIASRFLVSSEDWN